MRDHYETTHDMQTTISVKRNKDIAAFEYDKAMLAQDLLKARAAFYGEPDLSTPHV
jgi:hypothetical protein